tara:strand:+ start:1724 stop:2095 length:372 start_codon:yes stop_codon:yes gene_type:complete
MNTFKLIKENPNVAELLHNWFFDKLTESFKNFDKDEAFKDYMMAKGVSEKQVMATMIDNPRACFDLLDSHEVIITIHYDKNYKTWYSSYHSPELSVSYASRIDCERGALEMGIVELEEKIKKK